LIVADVEGEWELVTQEDHAHLAADILSLLRLPELVGNPRRDLLILATREHDRGWRGEDAAPRVDRASGWPIGFRRIADPSRRDIWSRSCSAHSPDEPAYVRLLIVLHGLFLHRDMAGLDDWDGWLAGLRERRRELLDECGLSRDEAEADHAWLALADLCSLAICERREQTFSWAGIEGLADGTALRLAPFPLAGTTTFTYCCRRLPVRPLASDRELGLALAAARWGRRRASVRPAGD
jgi:hypothetical protein